MTSPSPACPAPGAQPAQPPHPAHRDRRHDRCRLVPRLRPGDSQRRPRVAARLRSRRCGDILHHAGARGAADLPPGGRLVCELCRGVLRSVRRLRHRLVLLVHVGRDGDGGADRYRHLRALLVSRHTAMAAGADRAGGALRLQPAGSAGVRRAGILVRPHQGGDHRGAHRGGARGDPAARRRPDCGGRVLQQPLEPRRLPALRHGRAYCSPCRS